MTRPPAELVAPAAARAIVRYERGQFVPRVPQPAPAKQPGLVRRALWRMVPQRVKSLIQRLRQPWRLDRWVLAGNHGHRWTLTNWRSFGCQPRSARVRVYGMGSLTLVRVGW